jgi:hypothetical protein
MRTLVLLLLAAALGAPAATLAGRAAPGDASLVVANGDGVLTLQVKGVVFGHFDRGKMTVLEYKADNASVLPTVSGAKMDVRGARANVVYSGSDVRFLFPSGKFTLRFDASGIDLSAVGKGSLVATDKGALLVDGTVSVNGAKPAPLPSVVAFGVLSVTAASGPATTSGAGKP